MNAQCGRRAHRCRDRSAAEPQKKSPSHLSGKFFLRPKWDPTSPPFTSLDKEGGGGDLWKARGLVERLFFRLELAGHCPLRAKQLLNYFLGKIKVRESAPSLRANSRLISRLLFLKPREKGILPWSLSRWTMERATEKILSARFPLGGIS